MRYRARPASVLEPVRFRPSPLRGSGSPTAGNRACPGFTGPRKAEIRLVRGEEKPGSIPGVPTMAVPRQEPPLSGSRPKQRRLSQGPRLLAAGSRALPAAGCGSGWLERPAGGRKGARSNRASPTRRGWRFESVPVPAGSSIGRALQRERSRVRVPPGGLTANGSSAAERSRSGM